MSDPAWWISWYSVKPLSTFELHSPWWVSGYRCSDDAETVCAAIYAADEDQARAIIRAAYDDDPGELEFRFVEELTQSPFSGRFPKATWMAWEDGRTCSCAECSATFAPSRSSGSVHSRQHARPSTSAPTGDEPGRTTT